MIIEPKPLSSRGAHIDIREVNILLNFEKESSLNVRFNIFDTISHLPLPEESRAKVLKLIRQELQARNSFEDKAQLLEIGTWISNEFNVESEIIKIDKDTIFQQRLLNKVSKIHNQYNNNDSECYDQDWAESQAPGFILFSESELKFQKSLLLPEISITASKLSNWFSNESLLDIPIENPVLTTLLFEFAAKDNYYDVSMINNLLEELAKLENLQPELNGLFEVYNRCVTEWIKDVSSYYGEPSARWFQLYRDDEHPVSWLSWQIAWTVSRGGLKGLIPALAIHLNAEDEKRQIAALSLISDSADYTLQRKAAVFGGGIRPPRFSQDRLPKIWLRDARENEETPGMVKTPFDLKQLLTEIAVKYFKISIGNPKLMTKRFASLFVVNLYFEELVDKARMKIKEIVGEKYSESIFNTELKLGQTVIIKLESTEITFTGPIVKKLESSFNTMTFLGKPKDECQPGIHKIVLSISDNKTGIQYQSETISVKVVDFIFDHFSRPLFTRASTAALIASSIVMFILTLLEQIDKTIGVSSGTAAGALAVIIYGNFYNMYKRIRNL